MDKGGRACASGKYPVWTPDGHDQAKISQIGLHLLQVWGPKPDIGHILNLDPGHARPPK
jgi:hypothetical protein